MWLAAATLATACTDGPIEESPHEVLVTDSLGQLGSEAPGELPRYATGTRFELVMSGEEALEDGWLIATVDPEVLSVEQTVIIDDIAAEADAHAVAAGETTIEVYDEADRIAASVPVQIRDADRVALRTTSGIASIIGERVRLLPGNGVNFAIDYMGGDELLAGRGLAEVETDTDLVTIGLLNLGGTSAEGLHVRALPSGSYRVQLRINGIDISELEVISVDPAEVALVLQGPDQDTGDVACATAELVDAVERRVFAEPAVWTSDGDRLGEGEMLCLEVDPASPPITATVTYGPFTQTIEFPGGDARP